MSRYADIAFPRRLIQSFTYLVPEGFPALEPGSRVLAPLGRQTVSGFVIRVHDEPPGGAVRLKEIVRAIDEKPLIAPILVEFTRRLSAYHVSSWGEMLEAALPPPEPGAAKRPRPAKKIPSPTPPESPQLALDFTSTPAVRDAAAVVVGALEAGGFGPFYAFGGTGERRTLWGKAMRAALSRSRGVLLLVPEIDEIPSLAEWASEAAGRPAAAVHGRITARAKSAAWTAIQKGEARVIIGSRAALFWPIPNLGLIIVEDEPHEAYLPIESPAFDVRRAALVRAEMEGSALLFGSDIPSVAAMAAARKAGNLLEIGGSAEPREVVLAGAAAERGLIVAALADGLRRCLGEKGRSIVFLNRRGYASLLFCPSCGFIPSCRRCGARPAFHKREDRLVCHACGTTAPRPSSCPRCGGRVLEPRGIGIEALEEEIRRLFPRARVARFDRDLAGRVSVRTRVLERFAAGRIDILVGTELLARQAGICPADFVGIVNPEAWLAFPDFTAAERAFQGVSRMVRFALPAAGGGRVVIQTGFPDHFSLSAAARRDYAGFYEAELENRRIMRYPPFSAMAEVNLQGRDPRSLGRKARILAERFGKSGVEVLGPAMASAPGGRGVKKVQILLRAEEEKPLTDILGESLRDVGGDWRVSRFS
jgi:primosomal protein N' (replication factor Y)